MHLRVIQLLLQKKRAAQLVYAQEAICFALNKDKKYFNLYVY